MAAADRLRQTSSYGFHNLDRRTAVLADGTVRSYLALPADYRYDDFHQPPKRNHEHDLLPNGLFINDVADGRPSKTAKLDEQGDGRLVKSANRDEQGDGRPSKIAKLDEHGDGRLVNSVNAEEVDMPREEGEVDEQAVRGAFLRYVKEINENYFERDNYLVDGKNGKLKCIACDSVYRRRNNLGSHLMRPSQSYSKILPRSSKDFVDMRALVSHTYYCPKPEKRVDHLGLHKALCVLLGWDYAAPENSKAYESLSDEDATANRKDLILWPPTVIIQNTSSGQKKDGRMQGLSNEDMDNKLKDLGFGGGKSRSVHGKEGHTGVTVVKFANTQAGLKEAESLADHFEKENHGLEGWIQAQASQSGDDDSNPALVKVDAKSGEKKRIFYGYIATVWTLETVDHDTRKNSVVRSRKEFDC